jgi:hypothetical protein
MPRRRRPSESKFSVENYARRKKLLPNKSGSCVGVLTPPQPEDVSSGLLILFVPRSKLTGYKKNKHL